MKLVNLTYILGRKKKPKAQKEKNLSSVLPSSLPPSLFSFLLSFLFLFLQTSSFLPFPSLPFPFFSYPKHLESIYSMLSFCISMFSSLPLFINLGSLSQILYCYFPLLILEVLGSQTSFVLAHIYFIVTNNSYGINCPDPFIS